MPNDPFYSSKRWKKLRARIKARDRHCCTNCGASVRYRKGVKGSSGYVDHIIERTERPDLAWYEPNLRTLCAACHNKRHGEQRRSRPVPVIGADGFPAGSEWSNLSKRDDDKP